VPFDEFFQWLEDQDIWHEPADSPRAPDSPRWAGLEAALGTDLDAPAEAGREAPGPSRRARPPIRSSSMDELGLQFDLDALRAEPGASPRHRASIHRFPTILWK
jgi:hypothetical protein